MQLVECVPNFSEGRRRGVVQAIRDAAEGVRDVAILDLHADQAHNRSVLTFVGSPSAVAEAAFRCTERAAQLIDLNEHSGEHPRMGATDVIPFVPLLGVSMADCISLAVAVGKRIGDELDIPVYLYAEAARQQGRRLLPDVRKGEFEGLREAIGTDAERAPDFGPARLGSAGATAVGARPFLIAYNVNLATSDLAVARDVARAVRQSSGGLLAVQARGMATANPGVVQVSMNLLDTSLTPLHVVYEAVRERAAERGVEVAESEVVGLLPLDVLVRTFAWSMRASAISGEHVIEARLLQVLAAKREAPPE